MKFLNLKGKTHGAFGFAPLTVEQFSKTSSSVMKIDVPIKEIQISYCLNFLSSYFGKEFKILSSTLFSVCNRKNSVPFVTSRVKIELNFSGYKTTKGQW